MSGECISSLPVDIDTVNRILVIANNICWQFDYYYYRYKDSRPINQGLILRPLSRNLLVTMVMND